MKKNAERKPGRKEEMEGRDKGRKEREEEMEEEEIKSGTTIKSK